MRRAAIFLLALALALGCDGGARREAEQLTTAVERFRRADNAGKPAAAEAIRAMACSDGEVCRARDACLAAADATSKALVLKSEVEQGLGALERGELAKESPEAQALLSKLEVAEKLLAEGHAALGPCDDQLVALKRKHHL